MQPTIFTERDMLCDKPLNSCLTWFVRRRRSLSECHWHDDLLIYFQCSAARRNWMSPIWNSGLLNVSYVVCAVSLQASTVIIDELLQTQLQNAQRGVQRHEPHTPVVTWHNGGDISRAYFQAAHYHLMCKFSSGALKSEAVCILTVKHAPFTRLWVFHAESGLIRGFHLRRNRLLAGGCGVLQYEEISSSLTLTLRNSIAKEKQEGLGHGWVDHSTQKFLLNTLAHYCIISNNRCFWRPEVDSVYCPPSFQMAANA